MNEEYRKMIEQIKIDSEAYTDEEMKPVYAAQKSELDTLNILLGTIFIEYGMDGLLKMDALQKADIGVKTILKDMGKKLGTDEVNKVTDILENVFKDTYYKNAYVIDSGFKTDLKFDILKKEFVDSAVNAKYKGELFSDRIWKNKADMIDKLQASLTDAMQGKTTIDKVAREIKNTFNVTAYQSQRLVNTENARVHNKASYDIGKSTGVKQVMWSATLDMLTAPEDADLDGIVWGIDEDHPEPPLHPNCRCCLINIPYEGWTPTQRKDNETKSLIDYTNYADWLKNKNIN